MARSLAVKVPTASLIALVEEKIAKIKSDLAEYPAKVKQFESDYNAYKSAMISTAIKALTENPELVGENHDSPIRVSLSHYGSPSVSVSFDSVALGFPEQPVKPTNPNDRTWFGREHATPLEMLEKTIKVLRMTTQDEVNASTYSSVMDLL
jgi:hypothetical protein